MTIKFMVLSGERSGSTWVANWLTTDTTMCYHDPLRRWAKEELDGIFPLLGKRKGIACTALQLEPEWVNKHRASKVVIHRHEDFIRASWKKLGVMPILTAGTNDRLREINGLHVQYKDLFDVRHASEIAAYLDIPFDPFRHAELVQMNVQPHWPAVVQTRTL